MNNLVYLPSHGVLTDDLRVYKPTRTFLRHAKRLRGRKALTKNEIMAFCWLLNGCKKVNVTKAERAELLRLFGERSERPITKEQTKFGLDWLKRTAFKLNGEPRQSKSMPFGARELRIIQNFARFAWVDVHDTQDDYGRSPYNDHHSYTPVWRVISKTGEAFDYYVSGSTYAGGVSINIV